jgi:hypothetical protein
MAELMVEMKDNMKVVLTDYMKVDWWVAWKVEMKDGKMVELMVELKDQLSE